MNNEFNTPINLVIHFDNIVHFSVNIKTENKLGQTSNKKPWQLNLNSNHAPRVPLKRTMGND